MKNKGRRLVGFRKKDGNQGHLRKMVIVLVAFVLLIRRKFLMVIYKIQIVKGVVLSQEVDLFRI